MTKFEWVLVLGAWTAFLGFFFVLLWDITQLLVGVFS